MLKLYIYRNYYYLEMYRRRIESEDYIINIYIISRLALSTILMNDIIKRQKHRSLSEPINSFFI